MKIELTTDGFIRIFYTDGSRPVFTENRFRNEPDWKEYCNGTHETKTINQQVINDYVSWMKTK